MSRDTVDKVVEVGGLNDPHGCQTDGFILMGGDGWQPTMFIRLVQDYGVDVDVSHSLWTNEVLISPLPSPPLSLSLSISISPCTLLSCLSLR